MKKEEAASHGQGGNEAVNRTANRESLFPQLPVDIGGFDVVRKLEINAGEESQESRGLSVLDVISNTLQDFLDNDAAGGNVLSLIEAGFQNLFFTRGRST